MNRKSIFTIMLLIFQGKFLLSKGMRYKNIVILSLYNSIIIGQQKKIIVLFYN